MDGVLATIIMFAGNFAPRAWAFCEGQLLAVSSNTALFSLLGTTYGGDGRTTFALPDLRGRVPVGTGNGPGLPSVRLGEKGGQNTVTLTTAEIPSHNHSASVAVNNTNGEESAASGNIISNNTGAFNEDPVAGQFLGGVSTGNTGGNQAHNNMQPFLGMNYVICLQGIYPSRS